jgi:hypothetical protein
VDKSSVQTVAMVLGGLAVLVLPAIVTILWNIWNKTMVTLEKNTHAIIDLKSKLDMIWHMTQKFPKMERDLHALHMKIRGDVFVEKEISE